ncbi:RNase adapter RapZ [Pelagivirga sediminicola]|uniref:RNase adapter RapZ n=1 Tax=Pelagivirga sediminicola TaxID=2170575 RepID=A0A2T7G4V2_9RHOB|nr:RNase adapter RapZ [Pelagivirga sediminicola]PVA09427.1 RNase adapter RapZ [Pelagivirga sediminicola]
MSDPRPAPISPPPMMLVTGPSGAGRSTAIRILEDMGYEAIDNLPLSLLPRLFMVPQPDGAPAAQGRPLALGVDARNRDFSVEALIDAVETLDAHSEGRVQLLYLDCRPDVLLRRFSETRRRHPMAPAESPQIGIAREMDLLRAVRTRADILIDTSELSPHDLRAEMEQWIAPQGTGRLAVSIHSFSYKRGLPRGVDMVLDCRFLRNPHWEADLRALDGRAPEVAAFVAADPRFAPFHDQLTAMTRLLLPAYEQEGKSYLSIALGCTGGQHRSVAMAETLARTLAQDGWQVSIRHRELERRATLDAAP